MKEDFINRYLKGMKEEIVSIDEIDTSDLRFVITYSSDLSRLIQSIEKVGLLNPPILKLTSNRYKIISGYKRICACKELGIKEVVVRVVNGISDISAFLLNLYENIATRRLNDIERGIAIEKLLKFGIKEEEVIKYYLPLLDLHPSKKILDDYLQLMELDEEIKKGVVKGCIPIKNAIRLLEFSKAERIGVFDLFLRLKVSSNKQSELITLLKEIALREESSILEVLKDREIETTLSCKNLTLPQKVDRIRWLLRKRRYPYLSTIEIDFKEKRRELKLHPEIQITPPPFFEGEDFKISFRFKDRDELKEIVENLEEVVRKKELDDLINLL